MNHTLTDPDCPQSVRDQINGDVTQEAREITDEAVKAATKALKKLDVIKGVDAYYEGRARAALTAALPHLATAPAPAQEGCVGDLVAAAKLALETPGTIRGRDSLVSAVERVEAGQPYNGDAEVFAARILRRIENDGPERQMDDGSTEVGTWSEAGIAEMIREEIVIFRARDERRKTQGMAAVNSKDNGDGADA